MNTGTRSLWSLWSTDSVLCVGCSGSVLSIGSVGSAASIGSVGSFASVGSIGSALSVGSALSWLSRWSVLADRSSRAVLGSRNRGRGGRATLLVVLALAAVAGSSRLSAELRRPAPDRVGRPGRWRPAGRLGGDDTR